MKKSNKDEENKRTTQGINKRRKNKQPKVARCREAARRHQPTKEARSREIE